MPKVTNAFTSYQATANREDLSNAIYNIDPFDTPVMSAIRRRNCKNRSFDWQTEFLPLVNANNAQVEGFVLSNNPAQPTIRRTNVTQISERDATVSGSQEEADAAGKGSEMAHQMALAAKVLKSDMETILCSRQPYNAGNDTGPTARTTEAFSHWLARAVDKNSNPNAAIAPGTSTTGVPVLSTDPFPAPGAPVQITEQMLGDAMQQAYTNGGSPSLWIVPPGPKRTISTFVGRSTTQVLVGKTEVVSTIDVIATDFGRVKVAPSRWVAPDVGLLIDPDYAAVAFYRAFRQFLMARTGDAETRMIVVEWGLEMRNPLAHMLFNGISK
jgi:Family of unknown function (DUF5309)